MSGGRDEDTSSTRVGKRDGVRGTKTGRKRQKKYERAEGRKQRQDPRPTGER